MDELNKYQRYKAFYRHKPEIVELLTFIYNTCEETLDDYEGYEDALECIGEKVEEMLGQI